MDNVTETSYCNNCKRDIPSNNFVIHTTHCFRRIKHCQKCDTPVLKEDMEKHEQDFHSSNKCPECNKMIDGNIEFHKNNECPKRIVSCDFCELELTAEELAEHVKYCGSRTEHCEDCGRIIMFKNKKTHLENNHEFPENASPNSSENGDPISASNLNPLTNNARLSRPQNMTTNDDDVWWGPTNRNIENALNFPDLNGRFLNITPDEYNRTPALVDDSAAFDELSNYVQRWDIDTSNSRRNLIETSSVDTGNNVRNFADQPDGFYVDDAPIPCEFCNVVIPASELVLHETGCRYAPSDINNMNNDNSPNRNLSPSTPTSGLAETYRHNSFLSSQDDEEFSDDSHVNKIPCEFCSVLFPLDQLTAHQESCLQNVIGYRDFAVWSVSVLPNNKTLNANSNRLSDNRFGFGMAAIDDTFDSSDGDFVDTTSRNARNNDHPGQPLSIEDSDDDTILISSSRHLSSGNREYTNNLDRQQFTDRGNYRDLDQPGVSDSRVTTASRGRNERTNNNNNNNNNRFAKTGRANKVYRTGNDYEISDNDDERSRDNSNDLVRSYVAANSSFRDRYNSNNRRGNKSRPKNNIANSSSFSRANNRTNNNNGWSSNNQFNRRRASEHYYVGDDDDDGDRLRSNDRVFRRPSYGIGTNNNNSYAGDWRRSEYVKPDTVPKASFRNNHGTHSRPRPYNLNSIDLARPRSSREAENRRFLSDSSDEN